MIIFDGLPEMPVERFDLAKSTFETREDAEAWLVGKGFDGLELSDDPGSWGATVRGADQFVAESGRDILGDGVLMRVGCLASDINKASLTPLPTFAPAQLRILGDLDIREVTLAKSPIGDQLTTFQILKAFPEGSEQTAVTKAGQFVEQGDEQIVGGYVLIGDLPDHQGDIVPAFEVEKAAHSLMRNISKGTAKGGGGGLEHQVFGGIGYPVESYIDHAGEHGIAKAWWLSMKVESEDVWDAIQAGEIRGFSMGGSAYRRETIPNLHSVLKAKHVDIAKADQTFTEIQSAVAHAIRAQRGREYAWIEAIYDGRVIYHNDAGDLEQAEYSCDDDGDVTLGESSAVRIEYVAKAWPATPTPIKSSTPKEREMTSEEMEAAVAKGIELGVAKAKTAEPAPKTAADPDPKPAEPDKPTEPEDVMKSIDGKLDKLLEKVDAHGTAIDNHAGLINTIAGTPVRKSAAMPVGGALGSNGTTGGDDSDGEIDWGDPLYGVHGQRLGC